ncbi:MAG: cell surface protein SprA [Bacteroidetes bacterium]|nr:cell surface protein SprA [Bacteroidota bacterium]
MSQRQRIEIFLFLISCSVIPHGEALAYNLDFSFQQLQDTSQQDTLKNRFEAPYEPTRRSTYEQKDRFGDPFSNFTSPSPLLLQDPASLKLDVEIDTSMNYTIYEKVGEVNYRPTSTMSFEEFNRYQNQRILKNYWKERSLGLDGESAVSGRSLIPKLFISPVFDRIFGGSYVDIQPNGFVNLDFGARFQRIDNPAVPVRQQRNGGFEFNQQISMNVLGKVGEKMAITANFDNNNSFDFQNNLKVEYTGYEEDIIKKIELGNVSMPIANSLITGGQSLFGFKTQLQFGRLFVTAVASRMQGRNEVISVDSGFQGREFELRASNYEENRNFFLGHFFRNNYERWLSGLPLVLSGINITRVEVYILNRNNDTQTLRNIVALMDLGEGRRIHQSSNPSVGSGNKAESSNDANDLFASLIATNGIRDVDQVSDLLEGGSFNFEKTIDFERVTAARKLDDREYVINKQLGYISLLRRLQNDEVLAVSYEYTFNGQRFKVGELTEDYANRPEDQVVIMKLIRPTRINTRVPSWDLMMKNIYNLGANQVDREGFTLRIHYRDDLTGIDNPSLHQGALTKDIPLIRITKLDQLNPNNDPQPDGNFDYIEGVTIDSKNGNIIFPVLEPFGSTLRARFDPIAERNLIDKFVYDTLYHTTKAEAKLVASKNKFYILGRFNAGSSNEIALPGINIAEGSVIVTAGNTPLTEGLDYTVDYNLGKVRIINAGILSSGKQIDIAYEKADLFNFQTRWLTGARFDYKISDKINFGATVLHMNERPGGISRFSVGNEPTRNTKYGFDVNFTQDSRLLTKMVDAIPILSTKERSTVTFSGEFAQILPGTSNIVDGEGTSYVDDFESATTPFNLGGSGSVLKWKLASTPETDENRFDLSNQTGSVLGYAHRRAKLAWYSIDNIFYRTGGPNRPNNISTEDRENNYVRGIAPQEIFPSQDRQVINTFLPVFDMTYFPKERGQYNYSTDVDNNGDLRDPQRNWGGITQAITSDVDFDKTNIEYIEFWMMDPFITGGNGRDALFDITATQARAGGDLYFNLGNISEDVIKDGRHFFENGLPADGDPVKAITTEWGRVTNEQFLTEYFDNTTSSRVNQDVGLDGLKNDDEVGFFQNAFINNLNISGEPLEKVINDPSGDNFFHYLDPIHEDLDNKIIDRYKNWNGMDGNSPISNNRGFTTSATNLPDNEDLNNDNSISDLEAYYEYKVPLRPSELEVGRNNIVDKQENNGVTWYLFRIPVRNPSRIQGTIDGFKSIRYLRTYLTGFADPVVLRMAKFQLVGSQWRKFNQNLFQKGLNEVPEESSSDFLVSVVNIEENSSGSEKSSPYTIPPGINRDRDNTSPIFRRINEQSLQVCVDDLSDRDARAVYKNVDLDLINYGRLKMFLHADGSNVKDDELTGFLRLGTDFVENYYEIEIPLKVTPFGTSPNDYSESDLRRIVWPQENEIDIEIDALLTLKSRRNIQNVSQELLFSDSVGHQKITVRGNPDISSVQILMIGIRNPESADQAPKSACLWANEMRVTDFNKRAGWAANGRMNVKLADIANITTSGRYVSNDFGGIQQRISERTREETKEYDISASINVDKFIPGEHGIKIPMFVSLEKSVATPKFDPTDPDTPLKNSINAIASPNESDRFLRIVQDRSERRSINFTNIRKEKVNPEARSHIYDVENLSFTYSFSELTRSNVNTAEYVQRTYHGGLAYNYSPVDLTIEPFQNIGFLDNPFLQLIKDFNFNPIPSNLSFRADLDRRFTRTQLRNGDLTTDGIDPFFEKYFTFNRLYNLRWNLTRSLSLDYNARTNAIIDEPFGNLDTQEKRDSVRTNLRNFGRMKNFNQNVTATYRLPLDKFPLTDWTSADVRYSAGYIWTAGSFEQADTLGNIIQNSREKGANGKVDLVKLYNKIKFLKDINTPARPTASRGKEPVKNDTTKSGTPGVIKGLFRLMMSVRSVNVSYSIREGTILPGFRPRAYLFGMDSSFSAPGAAFIFGSQDPDIRFKAAREGWLARSQVLTQSFSQNLTTDLNLRAQVEPLRDLKIQLDAKKSVSGDFQEIYRFDPNGDPNINNGFISLTPSRSGSYSVSFFSIRTAFIKDGKDYQSPTFQDFESNRAIIRARLMALNPGGEYGLNSQDVLIPSFIAAYGGTSADNLALNPFPKTPLPNWRVDYAGLSKIPALSAVFSSINLTHSYSSTFSINNFTNSLLYDQDLELSNSLTRYPLATESNDSGLIPVYVISQVNIQERFAPLIGLNVRTKTRVTARVEYRKERSLSLQLSNSQVTEMRSSDVSLDFGWTKADWKFPFKIQGRTITVKNDITFRMNFTIRDTQSLQRRIDEDATITQGNINIQLRPTISYLVNEKLNVMAFFERSINEPRVSNSYKRANTSAGIQVRFSLSQ